MNRIPDGFAEHVPRRYFRFVVALVMVSFMLNFLDRQVLTLLLQPIKKEFGVSDTVLGLLTGFSFAAFYATLCVPIARLADRTSRSVVIAASMAVWSVATGASALATSISQLASARFFVGIGEAGFTPAALSLVADYAPARRRATALSIANAGIPLGIVAGLLLGGWGLQLYGWRGAFLIAGVPGVIVSVLFWATVKEPRSVTRREPAASDGQSTPVLRSIQALWNLPTYRSILVANCCSAIVNYGLSSWFPTFLIRSFAMQPRDVGYLLAPVFGLAGVLGMLSGGLLSDGLAAQKASRGLWLCAVVSLLAIPMVAASVIAATVLAAVLFFGISYFLALVYAGPTMAMVCSVVPPRDRAFAIGLMLFAMNLLGLGFGPLLIGSLSDAFGPGRHGLGIAMLLESFIYVPAAVWYTFASRTVSSAPGGAEHSTSPSTAAGQVQ